MNKLVHSQEKGFTFVEIIVVLVVLGILAAIAVPQFNSVIKESRVVAADATFSSLKNVALLAFQENRSNEETNTNKFVDSAPDLIDYLEDGLPSGAKVQGSKIVLQDGTEATVKTAETLNSPAILERK